ncbi:PEP-CTERM sorting domain-containing protein [Nostoc spongiaeforme FACHB-130]|uniref:PEP-CTERM sorting domain-containing protein n=1 Tax=Nostoc spongiaeforme FACHB-130 TaxID=1357510 RepID=A0ABR8G2B5_9NOSO|nr:PEP-CTERM sorting domain-containing protein [Nostoc spongiaeforme]MBD2597363.1 PEP-CTERM sorting domain-containing protein [Nostoc spongiaeforme FACHB-130]
MCSGIITKAEAFSITPDQNGPTFILDQEKSSLKAIKHLEILDNKYDVNFITGTFEDLSPTNRGITTFYRNQHLARQAGLTLWQTLINFSDSSSNLFSSIEDVDGNLSHQWNIPFVFRNGLGAGWWRGVIDKHNISLFPIAPINASSFYFTELTYANFQPSTKASVPEPLTILGSLTAAGFGIAIKRKFVFMRQD